MTNNPHPAHEWLVNYLEGTLDDVTDGHVDQHVTGCRECCAALDKLCVGDGSLIQRIREIHATATLGFNIGPTFNSNTDKDSPVHSSDAPQHEQVADDVGRYEFHSELARGGMGVVYAGRDTSLDRPVVFKVLHPNAYRNGEAIDRFLKEARICGNLQHPGIVPIHDLGRLADDRPFFTMRRVEGETLDVLLARRENPADDQVHVLNIFTQVCQTVAYAHSRNIVHRDLKPRNIMVGRFGEIQVLDWGIAKQLDHGLPHSNHGQNVATTDDTSNDGTKAGRVLGTPAYMSPEQARDSTQVDKRTDVFALGAILFEILTGRQLYESTAIDPDVVIQSAADCNLEFASELLQEFHSDQELVSFCVQCLSKNRDDRPSDAGCVATALIDYGETVNRRLRQTEIIADRQKTVLRERYKRRLVVLSASLVIVTLLALLVSGYATHLHLATHSRTLLDQEKTMRRGLSIDLLEKQDDYVRTLTLASSFQGERLSELLQLFDDVNETCSPRAELARIQTELGRKIPDADAEFIRRLLEAHIWSVAHARGRARTDCLDEAKRVYDSTLMVFANIHVGQLDVGIAAKSLNGKSDIVRQSIVDALDDCILIRLRRAAIPPNAHVEWFANLASRMDADRTRSEIRTSLLRRDTDAVSRIAQNFDHQQRSPQTAYFLVTSLELLGNDSAAQEVLANARRVHAANIWLTGRVLKSDESPSTAHRLRESNALDSWVPASDADPIRILFQARMQMREKNYDLSLQRFRWLSQELRSMDDSLPDEFLSATIQFWIELGKAHPPAMDEFTNFRNDCQQSAIASSDSTSGRANAFRVVSISNQLMSRSAETADVFRSLDSQNDPLADVVFPIAQSSLVAQKQFDLVNKYDTNERKFPRIKSVRQTSVMGSRREQFATLLTLIAMQRRIGNSAEANAIANDARLIWTDTASLVEISAAVDGTLPAEAMSSP